MPKKTQHTGKAGQFAVMGELAIRGYNVAIPEVDIGDDVFVLNDDSGQLSRIQVKTGTGIPLDREKAHRCQFAIKLRHVADAVVSGSHYVLAGRCGKRWRFLVFEKGILRHLINVGWGSKNGDYQNVTVIFFRDGRAATSTKKGATDLSDYADNWCAWPDLDSSHSKTSN